MRTLRIEAAILVLPVDSSPDRVLIAFARNPFVRRLLVWGWPAWASVAISRSGSPLAFRSNGELAKVLKSLAALAHFVLNFGECVVERESRYPRFHGPDLSIRLGAADRASRLEQAINGTDQVRARR